MFSALIRTDASLAPLILRLSLGVVIFAHGAQKVLGWFGGGGISGTITSFTQNLHLPLWMAILAMVIEFGGSIALIFGFLTRLSALGIFSLISVAAYLVHLKHGFFLNWSGKQQGQGIEFHLLALGVAIALMIWGGGSLSLDRMIWRRVDEKR